MDLKSNGFNLEASRLRDRFALSQLCGVIALTMLFLLLQGVLVVAFGKCFFHEGYYGYAWDRIVSLRLPSPSS
ncbi:MAG: hypothetical protein KME08_10420 [Aphanothece sp. CMT-3BRIN-NPC111]|nr:hypothetical protein [Aphanothece sp. CMT-3BRIN-NPC111]